MYGPLSAYSSSCIPHTPWYCVGDSRYGEDTGSKGWQMLNQVKGIYGKQWFGGSGAHKGDERRQAKHERNSMTHPKPEELALCCEAFPLKNVFEPEPDWSLQ